MPSIRVAGDFSDSRTAGRAIRTLTEAGFPAEVSTMDDNFIQASRRENRFMGRIVVYIALASVAGTAAGTAIGAALAYTVGPSGTEGLIIQVVSWAIFAHLIIGMWAGYLLLADRTQEDLPAISAPATRVSVECATIDDAKRAADIMTAASAANVTTAEARAIRK